MLRIMTLKAYSIPCDDHITFLVLITGSLNYFVLLLLLLHCLFLFLRGGEWLFPESLETLASPVFHPLTFKKNNIGFQGFP